MSTVVTRKVFKSGADVAVRLPKAFGIAWGDAIQIEQTAIGILVRKKGDSADGK